MLRKLLSQKWKVSRFNFLVREPEAGNLGSRRAKQVLMALIEDT